MTTKTYLTTEQFIKVFESLSDEKKKELGEAEAAWNAVWGAAGGEVRGEAWYWAWNMAWSKAFGAVWVEVWEDAWSAAETKMRYAAWATARGTDLALQVKDRISTEHFATLTHPWTSCGLSLYAEDWTDVL